VPGNFTSNIYSVRFAGIEPEQFDASAILAFETVLSRLLGLEDSATLPVSVISVRKGSVIVDFILKLDSALLASVADCQLQTVKASLVQFVSDLEAQNIIFANVIDVVWEPDVIICTSCSCVQSAEKSSSTASALAIGVAVGAGGGIIVIIILIFVWRKSKSESPREDPLVYQHAPETLVTLDGPEPKSMSLITVPLRQEWKLWQDEMGGWHSTEDAPKPAFSEVEDQDALLPMSMSIGNISRSSMPRHSQTFDEDEGRLSIVQAKALPDQSHISMSSFALEEHAYAEPLLVNDRGSEPLFDENGDIVFGQASYDPSLSGVMIDTSIPPPLYNDYTDEVYVPIRPVPPPSPRPVHRAESSVSSGPLSFISPAYQSDSESVASSEPVVHTNESAAHTQESTA
jgi:hypothetical protein